MIRPSEPLNPFGRRPRAMVAELQGRRRSCATVQVRHEQICVFEAGDVEERVRDWMLEVLKNAPTWNIKNRFPVIL